MSIIIDSIILSLELFVALELSFCICKIFTMMGSWPIIKDEKNYSKIGDS